MRLRSLSLIFILFLVSSFKHSEPADKPDSHFGILNFHQVSDSVFRSGQPFAEDINVLDSFGIKTVINLRLGDKDEKQLSGSGIELHHISILGWTMKEKDLLEGLKIIQTCPKPVLIHCKHGSDRTGAMVASYRIVMQGWSKEDALAEMKGEPYSYNEFWFPNMKRLVNDLDVRSIKAQLGI